MVYDTVIVGGGPAGLTAAIYAGRARLNTLVLEKFVLGGQLLLTESIENFPGVYQMNSQAWIEMLKKQAADLRNVRISDGIQAERIEGSEQIFKICTSSRADGREDALESKSVIICSGSQPKKLGIPLEEAFIGRGISYCGTCDGPLFKDKDIIVVGGGNTAVEEALYLSRFARKITLVHRRDSLRATAVLQERAKANEKIGFKWNSVPVEIVGKMRLEGLKVKDVRTTEEEILLASGIFVFIGADPDTAFLKGFIELDKVGYITTDEKMMASLPGIFAAGDCRHKSLRQVVTACSDGAIAANAVVKFLETKI